MSKLTRADHVLGVRRQRRVQRDDVAVLDQGIEVDEAGLRKNVIGESLHAEGFGDLANRFAEGAVADDAKGRATHIADRMVEEAELIGFLPATGAHVVDIGNNACGEAQRPARRHVRERC